VAVVNNFNCYDSIWKYFVGISKNSWFIFKPFKPKSIKAFKQHMFAFLSNIYILNNISAIQD